MRNTVVFAKDNTFFKGIYLGKCKVSGKHVVQKQDRRVKCDQVFVKDQDISDLQYVIELEKL